MWAHQQIEKQKKKKKIIRRLSAHNSLISSHKYEYRARHTYAMSSPLLPVCTSSQMREKIRNEMSTENRIWNVKSSAQRKLERIHSTDGVEVNENGVKRINIALNCCWSRAAAHRWDRDAHTHTLFTTLHCCVSPLQIREVASIFRCCCFIVSVRCQVHDAVGIAMQVRE